MAIKQNGPYRKISKFNLAGGFVFDEVKLIGVENIAVHLAVLWLCIARAGRANVVSRHTVRGLARRSLLLSPQSEEQLVMGNLR